MLFRSPEAARELWPGYLAHSVSKAALVALVTIQMVYVCMVYGPIAAFLVEYFPAKIRYTSLSVPYHLGNGWFGGFVPLIVRRLGELELDVRVARRERHAL